MILPPDIELRFTYTVRREGHPPAYPVRIDVVRRGDPEQILASRTVTDEADPDVERARRAYLDQVPEPELVLRLVDLTQIRDGREQRERLGAAVEVLFPELDLARHGTVSGCEDPPAWRCACGFTSESEDELKGHLRALDYAPVTRPWALGPTIPTPE